MPPLHVAATRVCLENLQSALIAQRNLPLVDQIDELQRLTEAILRFNRKWNEMLQDMQDEATSDRARGSTRCVSNDRAVPVDRHVDPIDTLATIGS